MNLVFLIVWGLLCLFGVLAFVFKLGGEEHWQFFEREDDD